MIDEIFSVLLLFIAHRGQDIVRSVHIYQPLRSGMTQINF